MEFISAYFDRIINMTHAQIAAQFIAIVIIGFQVWKCQVNNQKTFIKILIIVNILAVIQNYLLSAITASTLIFICIIRNVVFYAFKKKKKEIPALVFLAFFAIFVAFTISTWHNWVSIMALIGVMTTTYGIWQKSLKMMKLMIIFNCIAWFIHGVYFLAIVDLAATTFTLVSVLIWFWRERKPAVN